MGRYYTILYFTIRQGKSLLKGPDNQNSPNFAQNLKLFPDDLDSWWDDDGESTSPVWPPVTTISQVRKRLRKGSNRAPTDESFGQTPAHLQLWCLCSCLWPLSVTNEQIKSIKWMCMINTARLLCYILSVQLWVTFKNLPYLHAIVHLMHWSFVLQITHHLCVSEVLIV